MNVFFGVPCILFGVAMIVVPGLGQRVVEFTNSLRGAETKSDVDSSAGCVHAAVWIIVGIGLLIAL